MINLIYNENTKIYWRQSTWVMMAIPVAWIFLIAGQIKILGREEGAFWSFMTSSTQVISAITIFAVVVAATSLAGEFKSGTIKLLLIRPISRWQILLSKFAAIIIFALLMLLIAFLISLATGAILFDANFSDSSDNLLLLLKTYAYHSVDLIVMVSFAFMSSIYFLSSTAAIGLTLFVIYAGQIIVILLNQCQWIKYTFFANSLNQYLNDKPLLIPDLTVNFSLAVLAGHFVLFSGITWLIFWRDDILR